jgi:hypothetical protein
MDDQASGQRYLDRLQEIFRDHQTVILRVSGSYTKVSEARLRTLERLDNIEFRLRAVEQKLMLRPPAA